MQVIVKRFQSTHFFPDEAANRLVDRTWEQSSFSVNSNDLIHAGYSSLVAETVMTAIYLNYIFHALQDISACYSRLFFFIWYYTSYDYISFSKSI